MLIITSLILRQIFSISEKMGEIKANFMSRPSASRDIKKGADMKYFERTGDKNRTIYKLITGHKGYRQ